jgi:hypothetical protein
MSFGVQKLTGVFPATPSEMDALSSGQITLVKCDDENDPNSCGLLQIEKSFDPDEMYGDSYGYRSGLNASMVAHLHSKIDKILDNYKLNSNDLVVDIGSNDAVSLRHYPSNLQRVGVDPTGLKFKEFYGDDIVLLPDFFDKRLLIDNGFEKAKVITSFSMFYDLEDPVKFAQDIESSLDDNGVWIFEQSYLPLMLDTNSFDTACHEHVEYYSLKSINFILKMAGLKIIDHEFNNINGGSISVTAAKCSSSFLPDPNLESTLRNESLVYGLQNATTYSNFMTRIDHNGKELKQLIKRLNNSGHNVAALGASTKGNVLLQYYGLTRDDIQVVGEVNPDKYGCYTPGSNIPIVSEDEVLEGDYEFLLVLPWHFKNFFLNSKKFSKRKLIFPLPTVHIVTVEGTN